MRQIFKPYEQDQVMLLAPSLEEMIPRGHVLRSCRSIEGETVFGMLRQNWGIPTVHIESN